MRGRDSNPRPPGYEPGELPLLLPRYVNILKKEISGRSFIIVLYGHTILRSRSSYSNTYRLVYTQTPLVKASLPNYLFAFIWQEMQHVPMLILAIRACKTGRSYQLRIRTS